MRVTTARSQGDLATVYIGELGDGHSIEFVESVQPPVPLMEKWVLIVSTLKGCPVSCPICDAGSAYSGKLTSDEIMAQIEHMVRLRFPTGRVPVGKFKIQFARMGDPAFNPAVLEVLKHLPKRFKAPGLMPSISTIAPGGCRPFLDELTAIKRELYWKGNFQMQFSIHSTSPEHRRKLIPCETLDFKTMGEWGEDFYTTGDRKISLNFAAVKGCPVDPAVIAKHFSPECFMIKLTPVNPTASSLTNKLEGVIDPHDPTTAGELVDGFTEAGYDTILSIGETRENIIGSNCGMYVGDLFEVPADADERGQKKYGESAPPATML